MFENRDCVGILRKNKYQIKFLIQLWHRHLRGIINQRMWAHKAGQTAHSEKINIFKIGKEIGPVVKNDKSGILATPYLILDLN
jgi:hypothetical protein